MDPEYNILGGYIPSFVQHLKDTGERLGLRIGSQLDGEQTSVADAVKDVAKEHTYTSWTRAEHNAFFRALSVHSRWRPDLIAACVPTRTEWEVWMYLEALEEGAAMLAMQRSGKGVDSSFGDECQDVGMQVDGSSSDSGLHSDSHVDGEEDLCEPALEVSQAWIDAEESMASWIVQEEHLASVEVEGDDTEVDDEPPKRKRGQPHDATEERARSWAREQTGSNEGHHLTPPDHRSPSQESTSISARERETLMGCLEVPYLLALDGILREDEEVVRKKSKSREDPVAMTTPTEHGDEGGPRTRDVEVSGLPHGINAPEETNDVSRPSGMAIDPVLLALSGGAEPAGRQSGRVPSESTRRDCAPVHVPPPNASLQSTSLEVSGMGHTVPSPLGGATLTDPSPAPNAESELSLFSPRSRRRIQKRLYMRRKRASLGENGVTSEGAVYTGVERLKPGRKAKSGRNETPDVSTSVPRSEEPSDVETKFPENVPKKNKAGLTLPYKLRAQFAELGIDAAYLRAQGMDLLNMGTLGKLTGLYSSLERGEEADESVISIDAELIRHLQAALVMFVTDIIHRAIVWKEREIRLKRRSQAWRHGDQITTSAVEHAVEAVGVRYRSHKEYLKSLGALHGLETEPSSAPATTSEEPDPTDAPGRRSTEPPGLSPHRDVYTPLVHPPSAWEMGPLTCLARTYEREVTRTRQGTSAAIKEEELMSGDTDEEALEAELKEEDEADAWDMGLAAGLEEGLWDAVRRR